MSKQGQEKVFEMITESVLKLLKQGTIPWKQSWIGGKPANLKSKQTYQGINIFILTAISQIKSYTSRWWLSYKQALLMGGQVRKGETSTLVIFWKPLEKIEIDDTTGEEKKKTYPVLRYYRVFNLDQVEGIADPDSEKNYNPVTQDKQAIVRKTRQTVQDMPEPPRFLEGIQPCYRPGDDTVFMPNMNKFCSVEDFASTIFHEMTHATGHKTRLNRPTLTVLTPFASHDYSKEELVAEMGSAFLCGHLGIVQSTIENQAAYIQGWLKALRNDKKRSLKQPQRQRRQRSIF